MKLIYCVLGIIALCGCASVGTPIARQNIPKIHKGVTTEAQLVQMFGAPSDKSFDNGKLIETWIHTETQTKGTTFIPYAGPFVGGVNVQTDKLVVEMGTDGKVENYAFNESHPDVNYGGN